MLTVAKLARKGVRTKPVESPRFSFVLPHNLMGVEVEVDSDNRGTTVFPPTNTTFWNKIRDGSLVNGFEYVLKMPLAGNTLSDALHELYAAPTHVTRTLTGSTHIHMDMLEEEVTLDVLRTTVLLVYMLEPMLYASGDASREWCGYSNSLKSAENMLLTTLFSDNVEETFASTYSRHGQLGRYYGLNLVSLTDYGSLEFRYFPTATSPEELARWVNLVQCFKKAALTIGTPEVLRSIIEDQDNYTHMLSDFFGDYGELHHHVSDWYAVVAAFNKAEITANSGMLERITFSGKDTFTEGRFGDLIEVLPQAELDLMQWLVQDGTVPPNREDGTVLIYMNSIYVKTEGSWERISDRLPEDMAQIGPQTMEILRRLLEDRNNYTAFFDRDITFLRIVLGLGRLMTYDDDLDDLFDEYGDV